MRAGSTPVNCATVARATSAACCAWIDCVRAAASSASARERSAPGRSSAFTSARIVASTAWLRSTPAWAARTVSSGGDKRQVRVGSGRSDFELRALKGRLGLEAAGRRGIHAGAPQAEIERLPGDQHAYGAAPRGTEVVRADNRSGHGGDHALGGQEQSENIIACGPVSLRHGIHARQVGGAGQADARRGGVDLLLGDAHGRVVVQGAFDGL